MQTTISCRDLFRNAIKMEIGEVLTGRDVLSFITEGQHAPHYPMTGAILIETLCFLPMMRTTIIPGSLNYNVSLGLKSPFKRAISSAV